MVETERSEDVRPTHSVRPAQSSRGRARLCPEGLFSFRSYVGKHLTPSVPQTSKENCKGPLECELQAEEKVGRVGYMRNNIQCERID